MSYLTRLRTHAPVGRAPGPGREQRWRLRLGARRLGAAAPVPRPRLRGRQLLRGRAAADARERRGGRAAASRPTAPAWSPPHRRDFWDAGRAPKNDPALFALALAPAKGDPATRKAALEALPKAARTRYPTCSTSPQYLEGFRGWGRGPPDSCPGVWYLGQLGRFVLAYQAVKCRQREGVTHRDVLRLAHPAGRVSAGNPTLAVTRRAAPPVRVDRPRRRDRRPAAPGRGLRARPGGRDAGPGGRARPRVPACRARRSAASTSPRPSVWAALLEDMPMTALVRNLATMTRVGVLAPGSDGTATGGRAARRPRAHPQGARSPDRAPGGAAHVRGRSRCARQAQLEPGRGDRRRPERGLLPGVQEHRAGGQQAPARARRLELDGLPGKDSRYPRPHPGDASRARPRDGGDQHSGKKVGFSAERGLYRGRGRWAGPGKRPHAARDHPSAAARRRGPDGNGLPFGGTDCALPMLGEGEQGGGRHLRDLHRQRDLGREGSPLPGAPGLPGRRWEPAGQAHRRRNDGGRASPSPTPRTLACSMSSASTRATPQLVSEFARGAL